MTSILQSLLAEFAPVERASVERPSQAVQERCPRCQGIEHWQPHGSSDWYCNHCDPPPTQSMIANQTGAPKITSSVAYAVGHHGTHSMSFGGNRIDFPAFNTQPVCQCGSHMVVEHAWSDSMATYECASCAASIAAELVR